MPRLFFAIPLPAEVKALMAVLHTNLPGARWAGPEQSHLTLHFLGDQDAALLPALATTLHHLTIPPFALTTGNCGVFPSARQPRVLWLGLEESPPLRQLQTELAHRLRGQGIPLEDRPFHPHLTLARLRETPPIALRSLLHQPPPHSPVTFRVDQVTLYASSLGQNGATHTPLATGKLPDTPNLNQQELS